MRPLCGPSLLVPRKALDGVQYGGNQPTDISEINRRVYWPRPFSIPDQQRRLVRKRTRKKRLLTGGSHINVAFSRGAGWRGLCPAQTVTDRTVGYNAWLAVPMLQEST